MRPLGRVLLCCLLTAGCGTVEPAPSAPPAPPSEVAAEAPPSTPAPAPEQRGRFERARETAGLEFFTFTERVGQVVSLPFQAALLGLYFLLFPVIGYGPGGPG
jgi:hypothetical protein